MEHTKEMLSIPLSNLVPSPYNVRRHTTTQVEELAALIDAQGLLHNLIVTKHVCGRGKARKVRFAVAAGERRRRAMLLLQQHGRLPDTHEVSCELVPPERGLEVSLAENSGREAMHPADEFEAFSTLIAEGKGIEDVALRFGVSPLVVQRRLKLASLSPTLLALYREEGINLDQLMALTLSDDHAAQERTWFEAQHWNRTAAALRRALTASDVEATGSALVRFVGIESYESAGGAVRRDLFDDRQSGYLCDADLLRRLAQQKLDGLADTVREEGWSWVEARIELDSMATRQFTALPHTTRNPTEQERIDLAEIDARDAELDRQSRTMQWAEGWSADEAECINLEERDLALRRKAIREGLRTWSRDWTPQGGAIVTIGREGDSEIIRGLIREADRKALQVKERRSGAGTRPSGAPTEDGAVAGSAPESASANGHRLSEALMRRLTAHRTAALQAMLSQTTQVALAALAHAFMQDVFGEGLTHGRSALQVTVRVPRHELLGAADDLEASRAWGELLGRLAAWRERLPEELVSRLSWLIALPQAELLDLLALCAAATLNGITSQNGSRDIDDLADALGLDMADWWEPTADGYLKHVSKAQIVQALNEASPELATDGIAGMKKDALVIEATSRLAGKRWVPAPLRLKLSS